MELYLLAVLILVLVIVWYFLKKPQVQKAIYIIGEKNSGKTALLYYLANRNNNTKLTNSIEETQIVVQKDNKSITIVDIPAINYTKENFFQNLQNANKLVLMVDSSQLSSIAQTAEYIYDILINIHFQKNRTPLLIALNKQDEPKSFKENDFEVFLSKEIERIKKSRKAVPDQRQNVNDRIKYDESYFELSSFQNIKICECSIHNEEISIIEKFIFTK